MLLWSVVMNFFFCCCLNRHLYLSKVSVIRIFWLNTDDRQQISKLLQFSEKQRQTEQQWQQWQSDNRIVFVWIECKMVYSLFEKSSFRNRRMGSLFSSAFFSFMYTSRWPCFLPIKWRIKSCLFLPWGKNENKCPI